MNNSIECLPSEIQNEIGLYLNLKCNCCTNQIEFINYLNDNNIIIIGKFVYCNVICLNDYFFYA